MQPTSTLPQKTPPQPSSRLERIWAYRVFLLLATGVLALDQLTKFWISSRLPFPTYGPPYHVEVIPGFFNLVHVGNPGAAWSILQGYSKLLGIFAIITLVAIFFWRRSIGLRLKPVQISFGLLCGGILGNLIDRLLHGHVIDFLDFKFGSYTYPTFNIADSGICVGVIIYLIFSFRNPNAIQRTESNASDSTPRS
jgi:signal peptidase II